MGLPFTNSHACCTSPSFVFGARFATPLMPLGTVHAPRACCLRCSPKGPKLEFQYLPAYKTLHCVHGIPPIGFWMVAVNCWRLQEPPGETHSDLRHRTPCPHTAHMWMGR